MDVAMTGDQGGGSVGTSTASGVFRWQFAGREFDEGRWELRVGGNPVELERKPLEVLQYLLQHAGEAVGKEELLAEVWAGRIVVEAALTNAVGKLRRALGDEGGEVISTLPRVGYRLAAPVTRLPTARIAPGSRLAAGDTVPRRGHWQLKELLARIADGEVWTAEHSKTGQRRVFKFSLDGQRLRGLKREVTTARVLERALGPQPWQVPLVDWDFEQAPFFVEFEHAGTGLDRWQGSDGRTLSDLPLEQRLALFCQAADAVAEAHRVGVLHKDIKPANLLLSGEPEAFCLKVADFGSSQILDLDLLDGLGITRLGFNETVGQPDASGTPAYLAPELLAGQLPSVRSDVYALGITLYQLVVGDFRRPLVAGWEQEIDDPLLRQDIAEAANGDPASRLDSAAVLAGRIRNLKQRREKLVLEQAVRERVAEGERRLARVRARRPWLVATFASLLVGLAVSVVLLQRSRAAEQEAVAQRDVARALNGFVAQDILAAANPFESGDQAMTMKQALDRAAPRIEARFARQPDVAGPLHEVVGQAYYQLADYANATSHFQTAAGALERLYGTDAAPVQLQQLLVAESLARAGKTGQAQQLLDRTAAAISALPSREQPLLWIHHGRAQAWTYFQGGELHRAVAPLEHALSQLALLPEPSDELTFSIAQALAMARGISGLPAGEIHQLQLQAAERLQAQKGEASLPFVLSARYAGLRLRMLLGEERSLENDYREVIAQLTDIMGPLNESTLLATHGLAHILFKQEKWPQCEQLANRVRLGMVERFGHGHIHVANISNTLGLCLFGLGRTEEARTQFAGVLEDLSGQSGKTQNLVRTAVQINLGHTLARSGDWSGLERLVGEIRDTGAFLLKANAEAEAEVLLLEGQLEASRGRRNAARGLLEQAVAQLEEKNPSDYWLVRLARDERQRLL